ncbi:hypothetical protein HG536_0C00740 [Torulaspora globosa]|uniref:Sister chromatid cohesion protein n=1 Tax=Torulaspora globosa TaxID=48254 RepID=A0A7G3ZEH1_9SACH|nr:uncharacterized protein HG536_0C00740 [Torulaspora globosa]QLL31907.1 hypothetical protein HG536_0C00740 [Torulaspora globosa]
MPETPGESKEIAKCLVEAVGHDPVNYLVPKDGLSDLADPCFVPALGLEQPFASLADGTIPEMKAISFHIADESGQRLAFKRPRSMTVLAEPSGEGADLYDGLSPLAKMCLDANDCQVFREDIKESQPANASRPMKRKSEASERSDQVRETDAEPPAKRSKGGSGITINGVDLGDKYLQEFACVYESLSEGPTSNTAKAAEWWQKISDEHFVLSEPCLARLEIILNSIVSIPSAWAKVETERLIEILKILVGNIKCVKLVNEEGAYNSTLNKIAHVSIGLIFTLLMVSKNDNRLSLEQFVLEPIGFLAFSLETIKDSLSQDCRQKESVVPLQQSIARLAAYIDRTSYLDDSLAFRIISLFAGLLMESDLNFGNDMQLQNCWENITDYSRKILVSLFRKYPQHREFVVEELLSQAENTPCKRNQKNLRRVEDGIFVTDFTLTLIRMLENLNCLEACKADISDANTSNDALILVTEKYRQNIELLNGFGNQVIDTIWGKFHQSPSKYRHVLENYLLDLVALLPYPSYAISELLLAQSFGKLLTELTAAQQHPANVETISLQILGTAGACIFGIKCATRPNEGNNVIRLVNYPENLPQFMESYENCLKFCLSKPDEKTNVAYFWHQTIGALLKAIEYTKDDKTQNEKIAKLVMNEVQRAQSLLGNNTYALKVDYPDIKRNYFSYLHAFELINYYELYLKLLLSLLESEKIKIKSTAIKCLSMLAARDHTILSSPMIKVTIGKTLENSPASVKDAILDLISIGSSAVEYYRQLNTSFDDESILVRKHILRINEKIYSETDSQSIRAFVASRIMLRLEDEEDVIIEMARSILMKRWIFSITEEQSVERQRVVCDDVINSMAGVVSLNDNCSRHFEWLLNFYLLNEEILSPRTSEEVKQCLSNLTDVLVQKITEIEGLSDSGEEKIEQGPLLNLLAKFADCNHSFITKNHIIALYPYLISDEKSDLQFHILHVFRSTLDKLTTFKSNFLLDLETALLSRLPRMNVKEINEAMPLLWRVASRRNDFGRILKACSSCFQHLSPYINQVSKDSNIIPEGKLQRLIYLATGFARYCRFSQATGKPHFIKADESVYAYVAKRLLLLSGEGVPHIVRRVSVKNLTQLCGSHPKLFNSRPILALIDKELNEDTSDIKFAILESLYDFFKAEERESIMKAGVNCSVSSNERLKKKFLKEKKIESVSDGVCSALVTRFLKPILTACCSSDVKCSFIAVKLLKLTLQYGYINPSHCLPTAIGLVASTNEYMSLEATDILNELLEKYENMVFNGFAQGFKVAVEYSQLILREDYYRNDSFLRNLQKVTGASKKDVARFFKSVFKVLKMHFNQIEAAHLSEQTASYIIYLCANLFHLTFPSQLELVEVLKSIETLIDHLSEILSDQVDELEGSEVSPRVKQTLLVLLCLKRLKACLMVEYGLKTDVTTAGSALELKRKQSTVASRQAYLRELDEIFAKLRQPVSLADIDKIVKASGV